MKAFVNFHIDYIAFSLHLQDFFCMHTVRHSHSGTIPLYEEEGDLRHHYNNLLARILDKIFCTPEQFNLSKSKAKYHLVQLVA